MKKLTIHANCENEKIAFGVDVTEIVRNIFYFRILYIIPYKFGTAA